MVASVPCLIALRYEIKLRHSPPPVSPEGMGNKMFRTDARRQTTVLVRPIDTRAADRYIRHVHYRSRLQRKRPPDFAYQFHVTDISIGRTVLLKGVSYAVPLLCLWLPSLRQLQLHQLN
ncbi:hypothetical protein L873DRAFT_1031870 [Choiromyces venosus 120613-1]|uniref:Uncharacterized protein n=1 Tax=Choiromyces venosus 120613-1 TaxID=1336337 RepID=A0A3N4JNG2_9PEZI|nr:hypothetical protein L873DRAFT_1031870 [Choiromyces venosus 120613-1]